MYLTQICFLLLDTPHSEKNEIKYTAKFLNKVSSPINVYTLDFEGKEQLVGKTIAFGKEHSQPTYFTHSFVFVKSSGGVRLTANSNGVTGTVFEGQKFGASKDNPIFVLISEAGNIIYHCIHVRYNHAMFLILVLRNILNNNYLKYYAKYIFSILNYVIQFKYW